MRAAVNNSGSRQGAKALEERKRANDFNDFNTEARRTRREGIEKGTAAL